MKDPFRIMNHVSEEVMDFLIGFVLNLLFLTLIALLLWPLDRMMLVVRLAKGYGIFWGITLITALMVERIQRVFRIDADTHFDAYVISNLSHSVFLLAGWSAFAALTVRHFDVATPVWITVILYLVGFLSSYVAFMILSSFYSGHLYKMINLPLALVSFLVFAAWPTSGRVIYGWFFDLFSRR
jgi:hypothetical protein